MDNTWQFNSIIINIIIIDIITVNCNREKAQTDNINIFFFL